MPCAHAGLLCCNCHPLLPACCCDTPTCAHACCHLPAWLLRAPVGLTPAAAPTAPPAPPRPARAAPPARCQARRCPAAPAQQTPSGAPACDRTRAAAAAPAGTSARLRRRPAQSRRQPAGSRRCAISGTARCMGLCGVPPQPPAAAHRCLHAQLRVGHQRSVCDCDRPAWARATAAAASGRARLTRASGAASLARWTLLGTAALRCCSLTPRVSPWVAKRSDLAVTQQSACMRASATTTRSSWSATVAAARLAELYTRCVDACLFLQLACCCCRQRLSLVHEAARKCPLALHRRARGVGWIALPAEVALKQQRLTLRQWRHAAGATRAASPQHRPHTLQGSCLRWMSSTCAAGLLSDGLATAVAVRQLAAAARLAAAPPPQQHWRRAYLAQCLRSMPA